MSKDSRKKYFCKCPICGHEFYACKSIFQEDFEMLDMGRGRCPKCKTVHNLTVDEKNEQMIVMPWEEYMKKKCLEDKQRQDEINPKKVEQAVIKRGRYDLGWLFTPEFLQDMRKIKKRPKRII